MVQSTGGLLFIDMEMDYSQFGMAWYRKLVNFLWEVDKVAETFNKTCIYTVADTEGEKFCRLFGFKPELVLTLQDGTVRYIYKRKLFKKEAVSDNV